MSGKIVLEARMGRNKLSIAFPTDPSRSTDLADDIDCELIIPEEGTPERPKYHKPEQRIAWRCSQNDLSMLYKALQRLL